MIVSICIAALVTCSFCIQYFVSVFRSYLFFGLISCCATAVLVFFGKRLFRLNSIALIWCFAAVAAVASTLRSPLDINLYIEAYTICICVVLLACCGDDISLFDAAFKVILWFALFFAISVWIQVIVPEIFDFYIDVLPRKSQRLFAKWERDGVGYTGFSTNPGYTAGHLVAGMLLLLSQTVGASKKKILKNGLLVVFLLSALFMTGKRAHLLFFSISALVIFPISGKGKKRWLRLLYIALAGIAALAFLLFLGDKLTFIPALGRISETVKGLFTGADITNNRLPLYALALRLFSVNPIFGVGWGQFRVMSVGAVTESSELDAHNIYLQLLAETGVIGFICILLPMLIFFVLTIRNTIYCLDKQPQNIAWRAPLIFSLCYQFFFLIYGMTGNPLYDLNYIIMYFFACAINCAYCQCYKPLFRRKDNS